jgi:hypothetical protein
MNLKYIERVKVHKYVNKLHILHEFSVNYIYICCMNYKVYEFRKANKLLQ